tara:strand:+ start:10166 stop:11095 length:930 start_codon:yes stop_codon:yes gene_type:complete
MTTASLWYPHAIDLNGTNVLTQLQDVTPANNVQELIEYSASEAAPLFSGSFGAVPDFTFTTSQLKTVLDLIDVENVAHDLSGGSADLWYRKSDPHSTREAIGVSDTLHDRWRLTTNALLTIQSMSASQGGLATMVARLLPVWDGSTDPIVFTGSLGNLPASAVSEFFTLGRIDINGTDIGAVTDVSVDYQVEYEEVADSGEAYITYGGIQRFSPRISITSRDVTLMRTYGTAGTALTSFELYWRHLAANGNVVANGTATHIKMTATAGTIRAREVSGLPEAAVQIDIDLIKPDNATDPLIISDTTSTIT